MNKILFYEEEYYMLSNFSSHAVIFNDLLYMTSEHAYQAAKFTDSTIAGKVRDARSAHLAKRLSKEFHNEIQQGWEKIKVSKMEEIIRCKLEQHEEIQEALRRSGQAEIIENSPTDYFWGCGADGSGGNQLGKLWMKLRSELVSP